MPLDADPVKGYARAWSGMLGLVLIDGYDDYPVVAGEALLEMSGFWAAYFAWIEESESDEDSDADDAGEFTPAEWFGVSEAEFDEAYAALYDEPEWPVFRIPFPDGHMAVVVQRNFPEDSGTEYFIQHPGWGRIGYLATLDGHWAGPGLAWRELVHIARNPGPEEAEGIRDPHQRLLLLLPALGDAERPDDAAGLVVEALVSIDLPAERASRAANRLLFNQCGGMIRATGRSLSGGRMTATRSSPGSLSVTIPTARAAAHGWRRGSPASRATDSLAHWVPGPSDRSRKHPILVDRFAGQRGCASRRLGHRPEPPTAPSPQVNRWQANPDRRSLSDREPDW